MSGAKEVRLARDDEIERVHRVMLDAFEEYRAWPNPSSALDETREQFRHAIEDGGAIVALTAERIVGCVRFRVAWTTPVEGATRELVGRAESGKKVGPTPGGAVVFSRMAVLPEARRRGIGAALLAHIELVGRRLGLEWIETTARSQQPDNRPYYKKLGFEVTGYAERYGIADITTFLRKPL